jgi:hemerythrin-like domain-containing protein
MPDYSEIIARLLQDHVTARRVMAALDYEVDRVAQYHAPDTAAISGAVYFFGGYMKELHHPIEDMIYSALTREAPGITAEIEKIAEEHDEAGALVLRFSEVAAELAADTDRARAAFCRIARGLIAFQRHHLRREETKFFAHARDHLTPVAWQAIGVTAKDLEKNLAAVDRDEHGGLRVDRGAASRRRTMDIRRP